MEWGVCVIKLRSIYSSGSKTYKISYKQQKSIYYLKSLLNIANTKKKESSILKEEKKMKIYTFKKNESCWDFFSCAHQQQLKIDYCLALCKYVQLLQTKIKEAVFLFDNKLMFLTFWISKNVRKTAKIKCFNLARLQKLQNILKIYTYVCAMCPVLG